MQLFFYIVITMLRIVIYNMYILYEKRRKNESYITHIVFHKTKYVPIGSIDIKYFLNFFRIRIKYAQE